MPNETTGDEAEWEPNYRALDELALNSPKPIKIHFLSAYLVACRIVDRDHAAGVEDGGIIANVLAELASLCGMKP